MRSAAIGLAFAAAAVGLIVLATRQPKAPTTPAPPVDFAVLPGLRTGPPPWPPELVHLRARLEAIGLPALAHEATRLHYHPRLTLVVGGKPVIVPARIGIAKGFIAPLHTHDDSGKIHVESKTVRSYSLGEFFAVWGLSMRGCRATVGGKAAPNAVQIVLQPHQRIAVACTAR